MDAETAARAFERFYRGDPSRTRGTGGSGLGLSIAERIVQAHGGRIALVTAPGEGCRFRVALPAGAPA
jgi:two-component system OmpR family sensor kinase